MKYLKTIAALIFGVIQIHSHNAIAEDWIPDPTAEGLERDRLITFDVDASSIKVVGNEVHLKSRSRGRNDKEWIVSQYRFDCQRLSTYVFDQKAKKWISRKETRRNMSQSVVSILEVSELHEAYQYCKQYHPKYRLIYRRYGL